MMMMSLPTKTGRRLLLPLLIALAPMGGRCHEAQQPPPDSSGHGRAETHSGPDTLRAPATTNPFAYSQAEDGRGLVPVDTGRLPHGIRLAAVLIPQQGDAVAVLRLPGENTAVFIRENDLVGIDPHAAGRKNVGSTGTAPLATVEGTPFYLLIKSITTTGVEVAPRVRPTEVYLIR